MNFKLYNEDYFETVYPAMKHNEYEYQARSYCYYLKYFSGLNIKGKALLDYGCGLGETTYSVKDKALLEGYDISEYAKEFCKQKGITVHTNKRELKKSSYDLIVCSHTLEHVKDPYEELQFMAKLLKSNGQLILILPNDKLKYVNLEPDFNNHLFNWDLRSINNLLNEAGFKVIQNKILPYGQGYHALFALYTLHKNLYAFATNLLGFIRRSNEIVIMAVKAK